MSLDHEGEDYFCNNCSIHYSTSGGYVDFLGNNDFYAGEATQADMRSLIQDIDSLGYDEALDRLYKKYPYLANYINDIRRGDWICHCIGKNTLCALDIGSGLGNLSEMLSYTFQQVYALEAVRERVEFQVRRYKNASRSNIITVRGNALQLPFPDNYFDLVVCNGVLEWVGSMNTKLGPREAQLAFLREMRRVLSSNGCLYVGIENRFGIWFLLGAKDHSGLRYTSLIPRKLADIVVKRYGNVGGIYGDKSIKKKEKRGYYEYTYSKWGYQKLLKEAGYNFKAFWVYPSYNSPFFAGRLGDKPGLKGIVRYFKDNTSKFKTLLSLLEKTDNSFIAFCASLLTPSFLFFCYKDTFDTTFDDIILENSMLKNYTVVSGGHTIMYIIYDKKGIPKKIAHLKRYKYSLPETVPVIDKTHPQTHDSSQRVWIENWYHGRKLNPLDPTEVKMAVEWLFEFQHKNCGSKMTGDDILLEINAIKVGLREVADFNTPQNNAWLDQYATYVSNFNFNKTAEHGDFWYGNILFDGKLNKLNVIDWEYFNREGNPLYDLGFFILNAMLSPGDSEEEFILNLKRSGRFSSIIGPIEDKIRSHFGFDIDIVKLFPYLILRFVVTKSTERKLKDKTIIDYDKMLDKHKKLLGILAKI